MDRDKSKAPMKRGPNKVKPLFPSGDFIALGSKQRSSADVPDTKAPSKSQLSSAGSSSERKRESRSSPPPISSKKSKLSSSGSSSSSISRLGSFSSQVKREVSKGDQWDVIAIEEEPTEFLTKILEAEDCGDEEKIEAILCGAAKTLKNTRPKPEPVLYLSLMYLAKTRPLLYYSEVVVEAFCSILKRDVSVNFKTKGNNLASVLATNLFLASYQNENNWPELFVKMFVEDSLGDRVWVDHEECKGFVDNVLTAFNTRLPPKSMMAPEVMFKPDACPSPPALAVEDDDSLSSLHLDLKECSENITVIPRFSHAESNIEQYILEVIHDQLNRRQPMDISRNVLRLLVCACGISEVRSLVAHRLEIWLQNSKLTRPAQDLLLTVCMNCRQHNKHDVEVIGFLIRIRLKTKPVVNHFLQCMKELLGQHSDNLSTVLKHAIYNELSQSRNPNNMQLLSVIFQHSPKEAARVLAEVFQDLLINREDYLRALRALFREIIRSLRHDLNFQGFCLGLLQERRESQFRELESQFKERLFASIADLIVLSIFLAITPSVREAATSFFRGEKKDLTVLRNYQIQIATIQRDTVWWLHTIVPKMFKPVPRDFLHTLHKVFFLEQPEHYYKDNWPPEGDRPLMWRLSSDIPLLEDTLLRIVIIGLSKEHPINASEALEHADQLVKRAAALYTDDDHPVLSIKNLELIELIFSLCAYHHPENISLPSGYSPPNLAIAESYWKAWIMLLILTAHNPETYGKIAWEDHPTLRSIMEMCITNHFMYPPPTMASGEKAEEMKAIEIQTSQMEKQRILEFESHLAAASTKVAITEANSLLLSKLITMDPQGNARRPPLHILDQLKSLNQNLKLGHLLCRSRNPDFLIDIIQRQGTSQSMPWLAELVESNQSSLDMLPVQCLCEYLLHDTLEGGSNSVEGQGEEDKIDKNRNRNSQQKKRKQQELLQHLQALLHNPEEGPQATGEVLDYFLRRLGSQQPQARLVATRGLKLVLSQKSDSLLMDTDEELDEDENDFKWLLRDIPQLQHFDAIRLQASVSLRQACQVENDPGAISSYVNFLSLYSPDECLADLSLDMAQLIVERPTIINCILPPDNSSENVKGQTFLRALLDIFTRYLQRARRPSKDMYWYQCQDHIMVQWTSGETATMHILVVHSMIILLTYGPPKDDLTAFKDLLETWFPSDCEPPQAFLVDTSEEALLLPDWLKLRMIRSSVATLVDAALKDLDPTQLVLFIQSFGIPVSSMSKLLSSLDVAVQYDSMAVEQAVVDKAYMSQLVQVQHQRGAVGGEKFYNLLGENDSMESGADAEEMDPVPISVIQHAPPRVQEPFHLESVSAAVVQLFGMDTSGTRLTLKQEQELFRGLQKAFSQDVLRKCLFGGCLAEFIHTCEQILEGNECEKFVRVLHKKSFMSCSLFRLSIAAQQREAANSPLVIKFQRICSQILAISQYTSPLTYILKQYVTFHSSASRKKELLYQKLAATDMKSSHMADLLSTVATQESNRFEEALCFLVQKAIKTGDSQQLIHAVTKLLVENVLDKEKGTTSYLIVDWMEQLEPECIASSSALQLELLFSKHSLKDRNLTSVFRPYLLALLIHRAHWNTLHVCIEEILGKDYKKYDPAAVLDFLSACIYVPKIWQGRDKKNPKHYSLEKVLVLDSTQVCNLVRYLLEEYLEKSNISGDNQKNNFAKRLPLLEQCCSDDILVSSVVHFLVDIILHDQCLKDAASQLLTELYLCLPSIIFTVDGISEILKDMNPEVEGQTKVDALSHTLLLAVSVADVTKHTVQKLNDLNIACRKLAAMHPVLLLRQLPLLASLLRSRVSSANGIFGSKNKISLFVCSLGILELLGTHLFRQEYLSSVDDIFTTYMEAFHTKTRRLKNSEKEMIMNLLNRYLMLIHHYFTNNSADAQKFVQKNTFMLQDISSVFPDLMSLRTLLAGTSILHYTSENDENAGVMKVPLLPTPSSVKSYAWTHLAPLAERLSMDNENNPDDILAALQDLENVALKKPEILECFKEDLQRLLQYTNHTCCQLACKLILTCIRNNPKVAGQFISGYLQCLSSERRDIVQVAMDHLPEFVVLAQEHGSLLLQKAFQVSISTNIDASLPVSETILLLNLQYGN